MKTLVNTKSATNKISETAIAIRWWNSLPDSTKNQYLIKEFPELIMALWIEVQLTGPGQMKKS